jgi:tetratricopeptide (TPR) repeat protein
MDAGLSLAQVAGSELTRQAVHLIESGKVRPTARSLRYLSRRLGVLESTLLAPPPPGSDDLVINELAAGCERQEYDRVADEALLLVALDASPRLLAYAHHHAGLALYRLGRPGEAVIHLRAARERFEALGSAEWAAESMDWEAFALNMMEDPEALRVGRMALRRYRSVDARRPEVEARMLQHLGSICYGRRDYRRGCAYYDAALCIDGGVRELSTIARAYHGLGMCHLGLHDLRQAAELLFKAVTLYEAEQRIAPGPVRQDRPRAENDLGMVAMAQGDLERAEELFQAALEHYEAAGIERLQGHTLLGLGELRQRQGRLDDALPLVLRAIDRASALDETFTVIAGHQQLGELRAARGEHEQADASFRHALALCAEAALDERTVECSRAYQRVLAERRQSRRRAAQVASA